MMSDSLYIQKQSVVVAGCYGLCGPLVQELEACCMKGGKVVQQSVVHTLFGHIYLAATRWPDSQTDNSQLLNFL
jgi:hypothetical protein